MPGRAAHNATHNAAGLMYCEYAKQAALTLVNPAMNDGQLDTARIEQMISELSADGSWLGHESQRAHIERNLLALRDNPELRALVNGTCEAPGNGPRGPARDTIRATVNLPPSQKVEKGHARQAMIMALLGSLQAQHGANVSYAKSIAGLMHAHMPLQAAQAWKSLLENNHLRVEKGNSRIQVPIAIPAPARPLHASLAIAPDGRLADGTAVHEAPGLQAALRALGIPAHAMQDAVSTALARLRTSDASTAPGFHALIEDIVRDGGHQNAHRWMTAAVNAFAGADEVRLLRIWESTMASAAQNGISSHHTDKLRKTVMHGGA